MSRWVLLGAPLVLVLGCSDDGGDKGEPDAAPCQPTTCQAAGKNCVVVAGDD